MLIIQMETEDVLRVYIILIKTGMPRYVRISVTFLRTLANAPLLQAFGHILISVPWLCSYIVLSAGTLCPPDSAVSESRDEALTFKVWNDASRTSLTVRLKESCMSFIYAS